jgi:type IV secretory pathway VirB2 component (pilin)
MKYLFSILLLLAFFTLGYTSVVRAQVTVCNPSTGKVCPRATSTAVSATLQNPFKGSCGSDSCGIADLFRAIVDHIILPVGGVLAVLTFIWAGFKYVLARGKPDKISEAHRTLGYAILGTVLLLGAYAITDVITGTIHQLGGPDVGI